MEIGLSSFKSEKDIGVPLSYFLVLLTICITPTLFSLFSAGISGNIAGLREIEGQQQQSTHEFTVSQTFNAIWCTLGIGISLFTCIFAAIEFRIKKELVASVIFTAMLCLAVLDTFHLLIGTRVINLQIPFEEAVYLSWYAGRMLGIILLICAALYFLYKKAYYNKTSTYLSSINYIMVLLTAITVTAFFYIKKTPQLFIRRNGFFTHPEEFFIIGLLLIWTGLVIHWMRNKKPVLFSNLLILTILPLVFASLHLSLSVYPFDFDFNFARFLSLIAFAIPLAGISLNYSKNAAEQHLLNIKLDKEIREKEDIQKHLESRQNMLKHAENIADMGSWEIREEKEEEIIWSDALYKILGFKNDTSPSIEKMLDLIAEPSNRKKLSDAINTSLKTQKSFDLEIQILSDDGVKKEIRWLGKYLNEDRKLIGTCVDITVIKQAQKKLERNETILKQAESISHVGSFEWNETDGIQFISDELYRIHSLPVTNKITDIDFYRTMVHPDDIKRCEETFNRALKLKKSFIIEYRIINQDKEVRYLYANAKVIKNTQDYFGIRGTIQDITELKNAAILIEKTESIYRTIARNVPDSLVMIFNKDYDLLLQEGSIESGISLETEPDIAEAFFGNELKENLRRAFNDEQLSVEHTKNGRYYKTDFIPVKNLDGEIFNVMVVAQDISGLKAVQKDLEKKVEELRRSNTDLEQFAYIASHDLQEPLRKINAFGDLLQRNYTTALPQEAQSYVGKMQNAAQRMQMLIEDLLDYSKVVRGNDNFEEVNLHEEILKVLEQLEITITAKKATIDLMVNHKIEAVPLLIRQLFQNILSNSLKFSKKNVPPVIEIKSEILNGQQITELELNPLQEYCAISVKDNGIGFDESYAEIIFSPFQRLHTRSEYEGTGIGLSICKKIVERHNGHIYVQSEAGVGSIFKMFFPVVQ